ncbi:MAG: hypothetical protein JWQ38_3150 [Flavipsychrobacter sp.]|nr:hypothetical protein [Flavipsychrobacter sp.]
MRIKVLLIGDDPAYKVADAQLLRERGLLPFTAFNPQNIDELVAEIKPDVVFFDPHSTNNMITDAYNSFVGDITHTQTPVIFTLADDDVYLVTKKRTTAKGKRTNIADNIISAVKMALQTAKSYHKKTYKIPHQTIAIPTFISRA